MATKKVEPTNDKLAVFETALREIASKGDVERAGECVAIAKKALEESE